MMVAESKVAQTYKSVHEVQFATVSYLQEYKEYLEHELDETWRLLRFAWKSERPPDIEKKPWKSDVKVSCRECNRLTLWRHGKGWAQCFPECKVAESKIVTTKGVSKATWNILLDEEVD